MKISNETIGILKNFASINSNLTVKAGKRLRTVSPSKSIFVEATVAESFDKDFGIYDLNKFLAVISLFKDPIFDFQDKFVIISAENSNASVKYFYSDTNTLTTVPEGLKVPAIKFQFDLTAKNFAELQKASSLLQVPDISVETNDKKVVMKVFDKSEPTTNNYTFEVADNKDSNNFKLMFKVENIKMIPANYSVNVTQKFAQFKHESLSLTYTVALESDSSWE